MDSSNSINSEAQDVDKNFLEAEHFLSNFTTLRDECERLRQESQQLDLRCQQLTQELQQSQIDKHNLERHIQKETLQHKEIVWNLKIELQKSQEERLLWKEKYLDLCIRSSQNVAKDFMKTAAQKNSQQTDIDVKKSKKMKKRGKKRSLKLEKAEPNAIELQMETTEQQLNDPNTADSLSQVLDGPSQTMEAPQPQVMTVELQHTDNDAMAQDPSTDLTVQHSDTTLEKLEGVEDNSDVLKTQQEVVESLNNTENQMTEVKVMQVDPMNLSTIQASTDMNHVTNIVNQLTAANNVNVSSVDSQNQVVTSATAGYYGLQTGAFDLNAQTQGDNTTTFILQTSDTTFCTAAVIENPQRNEFTNSTEPPFVLKATTDNTFDAAAFTPAHPPQQVEESDTSSDENTEFNFRCNLCNVTFSDEEMLARHMKSKHTAKTNICKDCGKAYSTKGSLAQHVHHYHRHPNAYSCKVCGKTFNRKDFLVKHEKTHTNDREFQCKHCDKAFKTNASLSAHVNGSHNETRRFVCDYCGMRTSWRISYLEHMKLHTGEPRKSMRRKKVGDQLVSPQDLSQLVDNAAVVQFITTAEG